MRTRICSISVASFSLVALAPAAKFENVETFPQLPSATAVQSPEAEEFLIIESRGQFGHAARFQVRAKCGTLWLGDNALWIILLEPGADCRPSTTGELPWSIKNSTFEIAGGWGVHLKSNFVSV
jgi:hypothetical protein